MDVRGDRTPEWVHRNVMIRFLHSADWQLGARFAQFGAQGARLREARLETLDRTLARARELGADAFLVAGDLFEDNQVDESLVRSVMDRFRASAPLPIYLLPGNHDPDTGPDSVWDRTAVRNAPAHVHVLRRAGIYELAPGVALLASPLHQKLSTQDPSLKLAELSSGLGADVLKIGMTHGSPAIESRHQTNDFPIALNAASRAGLEYLALGHWHSWMADLDGGRMVMPGTPEPDRFQADGAGRVAWVEVSGPRGALRVQPLEVATVHWRSAEFEMASAEASRATLEGMISAWRAAADRTVVRVTLRGMADPAELARVRSWMDSALASFLVGQCVDQTRVMLSDAERADLRARHPILAGVLADLDRLESLATGTLPGAEGRMTSEATADAEVTLSLVEAKDLLAPARIELEQLTPEFFARIRQSLFQTWQEVES